MYKMIKDDVVRTADNESCRDALIATGWAVVEEAEKPLPDKRSKKDEANATG